MNFYSILLCVILNIYCLECTPYYQSLMQKRDQPRVYCGRHLRSTLALVCNGKYYTRDSRTPHNIDVYNYDNDYPNDIESDEKFSSDIYPFLHKSSSLSLLPNKVRRTYGLSNECCDKPCTLTHMSSYCAGEE